MYNHTFNALNKYISILISKRSQNLSRPIMNLFELEQFDKTNSFAADLARAICCLSL